MTPIKAIRLKCLDCCFGQINEVRLCPAEDCSLWPYRMGHNPKLQGRNKGIAPNFAKKAEQEGVSEPSSVSDEKSYGEDYAPKNPVPRAENEARTEAAT